MGCTRARRPWCRRSCPKLAAGSHRIAVGDREEIITVEAPATLTPLAVQGGPETVLFASTADPAARRALDTWRGFFQDRSCSVKVVEPSEKPVLPESGPVMAFKNGIRLPHCRADRSGPVRAEGRPGRVTSDRGAEVAQLAACVGGGQDTGRGRRLGSQAIEPGEVLAGQVSCRPLDELRKPFLTGREMELCPSGICGPETQLRIIGPRQVGALSLVFAGVRIQFRASG